MSDWLNAVKINGKWYVEVTDAQAIDLLDCLEPEVHEAKIMDNLVIPVFDDEESVE